MGNHNKLLCAMHKVRHTQKSMCSNVLQNVYFHKALLPSVHFIHLYNHKYDKICKDNKI